MRLPPHLDTLSTQANSLEREVQISKREEAIKYSSWILALYLVEFYIEEILLGFLPHEGFPG